MKRILLAGVLVGSVLLTGCEPETKVLTNLEYVTTVETSNDTIIQFKNESGQLYNFNSEEYYELSKDQTYNVEVTVEDWAYFGDYIERIEITK